MKSRRLTCVTVMTFFGVLALPIALTAQDNQDSKEATFITFDAPGAVNGTIASNQPGWGDHRVLHRRELWGPRRPHCSVSAFYCSVAFSG
jgi:hypothetical protein